MKPLHYFIILVAILALRPTAQAQFRFIGVDGQVYFSGGSTSNFVVSPNGLAQISSHHGFGAELGIPLSVDNPAQSLPKDSVGYDAGIIWKRAYYPYVGIRYRFFASNSFFIGVLANVGVMRERFFADRHFQYADTYDQEAIPPVYYDYVIRSPFFRLTMETGFVWNMGDLLYGTLLARIGFQCTKASLHEFGAFRISEADPAPYQFVPYQGGGMTGGIGLGMGVKL